MDRPAITPVLPSAEWLDETAPIGSPVQVLPFAPAHPNTFRVALHVVVAIFSLFLIVFKVALEPFGVPTGSMATAILGDHREAECPRCGYRVVTGEPGPDAKPVRFETCKCPNCGATVDLAKARELPGDRLLVDKTAFDSRSPRRWEVSVFHCPADTSKPFVKRVVGLPGEWIQIIDGDVYANGELQRKTLAQVRETRIAVFDMNYAPPEGWGSRFREQPIGDPKLPRVPGQSDEKALAETVLKDNSIFVAATSGRPEGFGITYRHWNLDTKQENPIGDWLAYNGGPASRRDNFARKLPDAAFEPAHDFFLEFDLEVQSPGGMIALRLGDGADTVRAEIPLGDNQTLALTHDGGSASQRVAGFQLRANAIYRIEFAFVDRRASLAIDGVEAIAPLDLPPPASLRPRGGVTRPFQLGFRGCDVAIRNLKLDRDIHYSTVPKGPTSWQLSADEYFLLGDNTGNSHDSRAWVVGNVPSPGVPERSFIGKPFLIHQPLKLSRTTVNGKPREIQTLDWSRVRWLR